MNKTFLIAFLFVCFFTFADTAHASTLGAPPNNLGLVGYWTMDGKDTNWSTGRMSDKSGSGNTGFLTGMSTSTSSILGKIGQALTFDGSTSYIFASSANSLNFGASTAFTISAWIKLNPTGGSGTESIVYKGDTGQNAQYFFEYDVATRVLNAGVVPQYKDGGCTIAGTTDVRDGKWHYVSAVFNRNASCTTSDIVVYVDGVQESASVRYAVQNSNLNVDNGHVFRIGSQHAGSDTAFFAGSIDEVRVYSRALSANEIRRSYVAGAAKQSASLPMLIPNGLITYWSLNNKEINWATGRATDMSGSGNTGSMISLSTTTSPAMGKIGQGLSFDGSTQYIVGAQTVNTGLVTMSIWFKKSGKPASQAWIAGFQNGLNGGSWDKDLYLTTSGTVTWYLYDGSSKDVAGTTVVTDGKWHHIVGIADGTNGVLYIDGVQDGTFPVGSTYTGYTVPNIFVGGTNLSGVALSQTVDEFRVYSRALSVTEIKQLYNAGVGSKSGVVPANKFANGGLVGYWSFNGKDMNWSTGKATDRSGSGYDMSMVSMSTSTSPAQGKVGQALSFDGSSQYLTSNGGTNTNFGTSVNFSLAAWIKMDPTGGTQQTIIFAGDEGQNILYTLYGSPLQMRILGVYPSCEVRGTTNVADNKWHHVVATVLRDASCTTADFAIYVDGVAEGLTLLSSDHNTNVNLASAPIDIGTYHAGFFQKFFKGLIDEVRIYNRILSASEVKSLYNQGR